MEGFKVTCLKCGNEKVIKTGDGFCDNIAVFPINYDGDLRIECDKCDNKADEYE